MAKVLKFNLGATNLDLQGGATGFQLATGWRPKVGRVLAGGRVGSVTERIPVRVKGSSQDNLAVYLQALHVMQRGARDYTTDPVTNPVYLHAQLANESGERRALVHNIGGGFDSGWYDAMSVGSVAELMLAVERAGAWERTSSVSLGADTPAAAASVMWDYTDGVGDVPGRIGYFSITPASGDTLERVWIGFRSADKRGTLANFQNIWECEDTDATLGTNAARTTDATASPGGGGDTKVRVTPGTATWAKRLTISLDDVSANYGDNFGQFLWLLRRAVSAGTWEIQLRFGYLAMDDDDFVRGPIVECSNTAWEYVEQGVMQIPLRNLHVITGAVLGAVYETYWTIQVWARRTSGAGTLDLDCICPIPVDEGFLKISGLALGSDDESVYFAEGPLGETQCVALDTSVFEGLPPYEANSFRLAIGDGRMVIVHQGTSGADITDRIALAGAYYPCWLSLRGAE